MRSLAVPFAFVALTACVHEIAPEGPVGAEEADVEAAIAPSPFYAGDPESGGVFALDISFWEGTIAQQEMDCFWDSGVRHIVSGTQVEEITRQQLDLAVRRGMTVDAYVYLYWGESMAAQVAEALAIVEGFPVGRLWLDVEEAPGGLGAGALIALVDEAVAACESAGTVACGIYTGPGFWRSAMNNTTAFADVPLWYAWYNDKRALSSWSTERFGGWDAPVAKQWAEEVICGVGADKDTMIVDAEPTVLVDRALPPDDGGAPAAPVDLQPVDGSSTALDSLKLSCAPVPHATRYEFALEQKSGAAWVPYFTWSGPNAFRVVSPQFDAVPARFRVRAKKGAAFGPWSAWSTFGYGTTLHPSEPAPPSEPPPAPPSEPPPAPPSEPPPSEPPPSAPVDGAPANLTPDGASVTAPSVTLACDAVAGAVKYRFAIETVDGAGIARPYFTYEKSAPQATFWPQVVGVVYRFTVQAQVAGVWGARSTAASFTRP